MGVLFFAAMYTLCAASIGLFASAKIPSEQAQAWEMWALKQMGQSQVDFCWLPSYGRGVGTPLTCSSSKEYDAGLCYDPCKDGYKGAATLCYQDCPSGFSDTGLDCLKPASYGRGAGYALWDKDKCEDHNPQGCEKYGALYYPDCKTNFHHAGCCICSPDCPSGMTDIGVSCQKDSYSRGVGTPVDSCSGDLEKDAGLCYKPCKEGYKGVGPVCWGECPFGAPVSCGAACASSSSQCAKGVVDIVVSVVEFAQAIISFASGGTSVTDLISKAVTSAIEYTAESDIESLPQVQQLMQQAYNESMNTLCDKFCDSLSGYLSKQGVPPEWVNVTVTRALNRVTQAAISNSSFSLTTFILDILPLHIGALVQSFDKPSCDFEVVPQTCSDFPAVCTSVNSTCAANATWACEGIPLTLITLEEFESEDLFPDTD